MFSLLAGISFAVLKVDAIVYPHKTVLFMDGTDDEICRMAGPDFLKESAAIPGCNIGDVRVVGGGNLPARHVIHTIAPDFSQCEHTKDAVVALRRCYLGCLVAAKKHRMRSIAFPSISTDTGFPRHEAAGIAISTINGFLDSHTTNIEKIIFALSREDWEIYNPIVNSPKSSKAA